MSRRYWIAAIVVGLIALLATYEGWTAFQDYKSVHANERQNTTHYDASAANQYLQLCIDKGRGNPFSILPCIFDGINASRDTQHADYDLKAQQDMAEWAFAVVLTSIAGLFFSIIGLLALFETLRLNRSATTAAFNAVTEARIANTTANETSYRQLRPYVTFVSSKINVWTQEDGGIKVRSTITLRNGGQTIAFNIKYLIHHVAIMEFYEPISINSYVGSEVEHRILDIGPSDNRTIAGREWDINQGLRDFTKDYRLGSVVKISYMDFMGKFTNDEFLVDYGVVTPGSTSHPAEIEMKNCRSKDDEDRF